jgi:hypothetical protein
VFPYAVPDRHRVKLSGIFVPAVTLFREVSIGRKLAPNSLKNPADYSKDIAKDIHRHTYTHIHIHTCIHIYGQTDGWV